VVCGGGAVVGSVAAAAAGGGGGGSGGVGFKAALIPDRAGMLVVVVVGEELRVRRVDERRAFNCMILISPLVPHPTAIISPQ